MARSNGNDRKQARASSRRKPKGGRKDTLWQRARRDLERRLEIHPSKPAFGRTGFVYIMRDAVGRVKVGFSADPDRRLCVLNGLIEYNRRPLKFVRVVEMSRQLAFSAERDLKSKLWRCASSEPSDGGTDWYECTPSLASRRLNEVLADYRIRGEWYRLEGKLAAFVAKLDVPKAPDTLR